MRRPLAPIWLASPSRFATVTTATARLLLVGMAILVLASLLALHIPALVAAGEGAGAAQTDVVLYESIVSGVRHGGNYYAVAADALRSGHYPLKPFVTFRLPTLAVVQAALPPLATTLLLWGLAGGVLIAWYRRLRPAFARPFPRILAFALLAGGMIAFFQTELAPFHEIWAGLLIALSLAVRREGRWVEAVAIGFAAAVIRETAILYVAVMAMVAAAGNDRREALAWTATIALFALVVALHAHAVAAVVRPLDPASPGWAGMLGFGYFVQTMIVSTALSLLPLWLAAPLTALALIGWVGWRDPLALRTFATLAAYALLLGLFGRTDTFYWGLLVAPTMLVGLAAAPDAIRDVVTSALDKRRITVTRVVR